MASDWLPAASVSLLLAFTVWLTIGVLLQLAYLVMRRPILRLTARGQANVLLALQSLPGGLAVATVALMYSPPGAQLLVAPHCHDSIGCVVHAPSATLAHHGQWLVWLTLVPLLLIIRRLLHITSLYRLRKRQLAALPATPSNVSYQVIDVAEATAFTFGLFRPRIYVSRQLIAHLQPSQLDAVVAHEHAHVQRRDGLRKLIVSLLAWPGHRVSRMAGDWHAAVEQAADDAARFADGAVMAEALLCSHRLRAPGTRSAHALESRIANLLHPRVEHLLDRWLPVLTLATVPILAVLSVGNGHGLIDWLLGHL